jgi:predicted lipoprotein with Yx(FWY)xxD motif
MQTSIGLLAGAMMLFAGALNAEESEPWRPDGIGVGLTIEGPVFVDSNRMTLYFGAGSECKDEHRASVTVAAGGGANWKRPYEIDVPITCLQKSPPLLAPADAKPNGRWTLHDRSDGTMQWAFDGKPLHTSRKDKRPGEINGGYRVRLGSSEGSVRGVAHAPLPGAPAGVKTRQTAAGLVLTNHKGKTLYYRDPAGQAQTCDVTCAQTWKPALAPSLARTDGLASEWSIVTQAGLKQWAYGGNPLYTYVHDAESHDGQILGDVFGAIWGPVVPGWQAAVLKAAPRHPAEVTLQKLPSAWEQFNSTLPDFVYADAKGMTLYTVHCRHGRSGVTCDDVGDDPRYWLSYCGGEARCAQRWRPLAAPSGAQTIDDIWSVIVINPWHPFLPPEGDSGIAVWAFRGRPVFTYAGDTLPGDFYGDDQSFAISGDGMQARPIPAYGRGVKAGSPVVTLSDGDPQPTD